MRYTAAIFLACTFAVPARAEQAHDFAIAPGRLGSVLIALGQQAGISIGLTDPVLAVRSSRGVHGRHSTADALRIALHDTGADFAFVTPQTVRVFAAARKPVDVPPGRVAIQPTKASHAVPATVIGESEIVVTASKQSTALSRYPGTATVLNLNDEPGARQAAQGTAVLVGRLPMLAATDLGPGRNKLFIRGVADSSFNGGSQATAGQYLGDARLTYNAPDPDLNLYDVGRVEIVEGPQGTLYGTGSIGGVIRLVPNPPDPTRAALSLATGLTATQNGELGYDAAGMLNLPVIDGSLALRGVAYTSAEGGYIDDPSRRLANINRNLVQGGRLAMRWRPNGDWTIDAGIVLQNIASKDGQYTLRGSPGLTRHSRIAQPFDNDYRMGFATLTRNFGGVTLTSTTSIVSHFVDTTFDATGYDGTSRTARFGELVDITLWSHETRIANGDARHPWLAGISGIYDISRVSRSLGDPLAPMPISGVRNETGELAVFGQFGVPITGRLQLTLGGRATYTRANGQLLDDPKGETVETQRNSLHFSPSLALAWRPRDRLLVFARFEHGTRAGGLAISPSGSPLDAQQFEADTLMVGELGVRFGQRNTDGLWASATLSFARWTDIQADLIDKTGLPYTTNIGDGRIAGFEMQVGARPLRGLTVDGALFLNASALTAPVPAFASAQERELPNIAEMGARMGVRYAIDLSPRMALTVDGALRYVGLSQLGIGTPFELPQGDYLTGKIGLRLANDKVGISLDIDNIGNAHGNRFAFGNPFGVAQGNQFTPLRPRNIRIGIDAKF